MEIRADDLTGPQIATLLREHLQHMQAITPPGSIHALDIDALQSPEITFWSAWDGPELLGCGALKELDVRTGEIKSMRTAIAHRRRGVASQLLEHILQTAKTRQYRQLYLETGAFPAFAPARNLYARYGFEHCGPFGDYREDPNSTFMTKAI